MPRKRTGSTAITPEILTTAEEFKIFDPSELEVHSIDVKRLRDDRSEIVAGDEIAFVATATFRLVKAAPPTDNAVAAGGWSEIRKHIASGDDVFKIGSDAEVTSQLPIDTDYLQWWIDKHYEFHFTLNGSPTNLFIPVGRTVRFGAPGDAPVRIDLPWIRKLQTAHLVDDFIDVDARIRERECTDVVPNQQDNALWFDDVQLHYRIGNVSHRAKLKISAALPTDVNTLKDAKYTLQLPADQHGQFTGVNLSFDIQEDGGGSTPTRALAANQQRTNNEEP